VDENISNIAFTRTVLGLLLCVIVLAVDELNPVKLFLHVFPSIRPWHLAAAASISSLYVVVSEFKELLYFATKIFINSMLSIFFRDIEVIGRDRLPRHGPMIFVINHANQFMDGLVVMGTCRNENFKISYLMAEKSFQRPVVGDIASALDVVPVKRAQDDAIRGAGKISFAVPEPSSPSSESDSGVVVDASEGGGETGIRKLTVTGTDGFSTSSFKVGDKLRPMGTPTAVKVLEILDETSCVVDTSTVSENDRDTIFATEGDNNSRVYDILKHVELHKIFEKVLDRLAMGGVFGIFPEGGSHDRTDLLPLKVGVALIAYSALERDGISVPIVPVGLNYFRTHRWRGRCLVEYGDPVHIQPGSLKEFQKGGAAKRVVCNDLLDRIKDSMRSVIVSMPDYDSLQVVHTARRLYQRNSESVRDGKEKQDLLRRFAVGYKILMSATNDNPPQA
jgi:glycerol-3-phosphate O-acyltransferase/dihydroxyacetone phosphate acyltransferase